MSKITPCMWVNGTAEEAASAEPTGRARPGPMEAMLEMSRLDIARLRDACEGVPT